MLTVWWLSSFILISTLNGYFDNQDRDFLTGKLQLTEEFLKTETFRNKTDIKSLSEKINDAMVGHNGLFISIKNMENEKIVELYAKNSVVPAVLLGLAPIFPYTFYHLTHYWFAAADIPVANDTPVHYADAIRCNVRRPPQGSLPLLTRRVSA